MIASPFYSGRFGLLSTERLLDGLPRGRQKGGETRIPKKAGFVVENRGLGGDGRVFIGVRC
jgi:hypothetical protein